MIELNKNVLLMKNETLDLSPLFWINFASVSLFHPLNTKDIHVFEDLEYLVSFGEFSFVLKFFENEENDEFFV